MSDPFKVPEPSERAIKAVEFHPAEKNDRLTQSDRATILHAGYHVDVPAIVRAEVERALRKRQEDPLGFGIAAYLAARFGEPEKECNHQWATETSTLGKTWCVRCGKVDRDPLHPTVRAVLDERLGVPTPTEFIPHIGGGQYVNTITPAERDFLRALARKELCAESHPNYAGYEQDAMEAACGVVEEAK